jgi:hypothetical protein
MHRTIVRTAAALLAGLAIALLSLAFESAMIPGQMALVQMQTSTGGVGYEPASFAEQDAEALVVEHNCWTGAAPLDMAGKIPGHVVVIADDEARHGGTKLVHKALQQTFEGVDHNLTVVGFCR